MKYQLYKSLLLVLLLFPGLLFADIAVLVHGYNTSGNTWRASGVVSFLSSRGWNDTSYPHYGLRNTGKLLFTVNLPARDPVDIQAAYLNQFLTELVKQYPQQNIHLVGHSSGGLVARLVLVTNYLNFFNNDASQLFPIVQLITIATPHLGSPIAEMAHSASESPISLFAPLIGLDQINDAEILYKQLSREHKNGFLYWLNRQTHPPINYISIARKDGSIIGGDIYVPPRSQDMGFVPTINNQSQLILTAGDHTLKAADGMILTTLLP